MLAGAHLGFYINCLPQKGRMLCSLIPPTLLLDETGGGPWLLKHPSAHLHEAELIPSDECTPHFNLRDKEEHGFVQQTDIIVGPNSTN